MNDSASVFEPWLLGREMASRFEETKFRLVLPAATLKRDPALEKARKQHRGAGIYFWVMAYKAARYRIYIGKTKSLSGRLLDYTRDFQPRSADDFKVQIFKAFMMERIPSGTLDLYFATKDVKDLSDAESGAITRYAPLLNDLPEPTEEERNKLKEAFSLYYRSALERKLKK